MLVCKTVLASELSVSQRTSKNLPYFYGSLMFRLVRLKFMHFRIEYYLYKLPLPCFVMNYMILHTVAEHQITYVVMCTAVIEFYDLIVHEHIKKSLTCIIWKCFFLFSFRSNINSAIKPSWNTCSL